jgi:glycine/D-amino acid oxidase-like deaminating enzyme
MFVELQQIVESDKFDYCIVGSGPAGITCALALSSPNKKILLLEGGGTEYTGDSQELYRGVVVGDPYFRLDTSRLRYFGGSSNHWVGWCRPLDEIDFQAKDAFPKTRWPIGKNTLDSYLEAASSILDVRPLQKDVELPGGLLKQIDVVFTNPVRFSKKYTSDLLNSQSIAVAFNASVVGLKTNGKGITAVEVVDFKGARRDVSATRYILACGGIENGILLLWSNHKANNKIIKNSTTLWRYWMEHPTFTVGDAIINNEILNNNMAANIPPDYSINSEGHRNFQPFQFGPEF